MRLTEKRRKLLERAASPYGLLSSGLPAEEDRVEALHLAGLIRISAYGDKWWATDEGRAVLSAAKAR